MTAKLDSLSPDQHAKFVDQYLTRLATDEITTEAVPQRGSITDLLRYAEDPSFDVNGEIRQAILEVDQVRANWSAVLSTLEGFQLNIAAAASTDDTSQKQVFIDDTETIRLEIVQSDVDEDLSLITIDLKNSQKSRVKKLRVLWEGGVEDIALQAPFDNCHTVYVDNSAPTAIAIRSRAAKLVLVF